MHWLLEKDTFHENLERLQTAITNSGGKYTICNYLPFDGGLETENGARIAEVPPNGSIYNRQPMFAYGSLQMVRFLQKSNLSVITFCNLPQFECSYYYPRFGAFLFQQDYAFMPYGEINRRKEWVLNTIGRQGQVFCRPNDGFKTFTGQLLTVETWAKDYELIGFYDVTPETMCVVAEPQNIVSECRIVIGCNYGDDTTQRVITGSCYKANGQLLDEHEEILPSHPAWRFAELVLKAVDYRPDPFWVMDVAMTRSGDWKVLEVGSMSCCGLYGCNLDLIVNALGAYHKKEWDECAPKPSFGPATHISSSPSFDDILLKFIRKELKVEDWNWCISHHKSPDYQYGAFIMGEGAEQCLASKWGFESEEAVRNLYERLGVTSGIMWI